MKAENNKKLKEKKNWILLLLKKLAKILFNRIFYVAVAMLVQLGWILYFVLAFSNDEPDHSDRDVDCPVDSMYPALVQVYQASVYR